MRLGVKCRNTAPGLHVPQSAAVHDAGHDEVANPFAAMIVVDGHLVLCHHTFASKSEGKGGKSVIS